MELTNILSSQAGVDELLPRQADILRERLGSALRIVDQLTGAPVMRSASEPVSEREVRALIKQRRNRDRFFGDDLFADPAWDILLELYAAALGQLRTSVSNLCVGAAVPATTALRWITSLEKKGMITRRADPIDGRRYFLMLSDKGHEAMNAYFQTVPAGASII